MTYCVTIKKRDEIASSLIIESEDLIEAESSFDALKLAIKCVCLPNEKRIAMKAKVVPIGS